MPPSYVKSQRRQDAIHDARRDPEIRWTPPLYYRLHSLGMIPEAPLPLSFTRTPIPLSGTSHPPPIIPLSHSLSLSLSLSLSPP
jgi:hypothetical protein